MSLIGWRTTHGQQPRAFSWGGGGRKYTPKTHLSQNVLFAESQKKKTFPLPMLLPSLAFSRSSSCTYTNRFYTVSGYAPASAASPETTVGVGVGVTSYPEMSLAIIFVLVAPCGMLCYAMLCTFWHALGQHSIVYLFHNCSYWLLIHSIQPNSLSFHSYCYLVVICHLQVHEVTILAIAGWGHIWIDPLFDLWT